MNSKKSKSKKLLVTGGLGFIGSNLALSLMRQGHHVTVVDDASAPRADWQEVFNGTSCDVRRSCFASDETVQLISENNYDCIFHLAALPSVPYSVENPEITLDVNVTKTIKLIEACHKYGIKKFVFSSSAAVYGDNSRKYYNHNGIDEGECKNPKSPYAWHKLAIEQYLQMMGRLHGFQSVSLRYFNVYGPGQFGGTPYSNAISAWCHCIKNNLPLRNDGDGKQSRDMVHVDNVVQANILSMESKKSGIYNIGLGLEYSNESIINYFKNNFPNISVVNAPERPGDVKRTKANIELAQCELNYKPSVGFWEGLNTTWEWWGLKKR